MRMILTTATVGGLLCAAHAAAPSPNGPDDGTVSAAVPGCVDPPPAMVAWWPFDETAGPIAADIVGGHDGMHMASPTPTAGMVAGGLAFDGGSGHVVVPDHPDLDVGNGDFTIDAWVRIDEFASDFNPIVDKTGPGDAAPGPHGYRLAMPPNLPGPTRFNLTLTLSDASGSTDYAVNVGIPLQQWTHVAVSVNRDQAVRLYLNGALTNQFPALATGDLSNQSDLFIGADAFRNEFFPGTIDELEIFDRALEPAEIFALFEAGSAGKCKPAEPSGACTDTLAPNPDCQVVPPPHGTFDLKLKWAWTGGGPPALSTFNQVMMTPVVADLDTTDGDPIPRVVFTSFRCSGGDCAGSDTAAADGIIRVVNGATGALEASFPGIGDEDDRVERFSQLAIGDIDNDGKLEIIGFNLNRGHQSTDPTSSLIHGVICFDHTGTPKWRWNVATDNVDWTKLAWGAISIADLDGDGNVEILAANVVLDNLGNLVAVDPNGVGGQELRVDRHIPMPFAADIDANGSGLEIIHGGTVFASQPAGQLVPRWIGLDPTNTSPMVRNGYSAVGNIDNDPFGEVVVVWCDYDDSSAIAGHCIAKLTALDHTGVHLWTTVLPAPANIAFAPARGGPPTIADFDPGMPGPEIGVAVRSLYVVFSAASGLELWRQPVRDYSSSATGSTVFDLDGDGIAEVIYNDECNLHIFDGVTGAPRLSTPIENTSGTGTEQPVIVDVDGDCNAEIVVCANLRNARVCKTKTPTHGVYVYEDANDRWVNTRAIWNQHAYSITNVNDDGSIPIYITPNWLAGGPNTFRANSQGSDACPTFAAPDLVVLDIEGACEPLDERFVMQVTVGNNGAIPVDAGTSVAFYEAADEACAPVVLLGTALTQTTLAPGESELVTLSIPTPTSATIRVFVRVDDDGTVLIPGCTLTAAGSVSECDEENNCCCAELTVACGGCGVSNEEILCPLEESGDFLYTFDVTNDSGLTAVSILVPPVATAPADGSVTIGPQVIPLAQPLPSGATTRLTLAISGAQAGTEVCFRFTLLQANLEACCTVSVCITLPECRCMQIRNEDIICATDGSADVIYSFVLVNLSGAVAEHTFLVPTGSATFDPDYFDLPSLSHGQTTRLTTTIRGGTAGQACMLITIHEEDLESCCAVERCIALPECAAASIPCDFDGDGDVDLADYMRFLAGISGSENATPDPQTDLDLDGDTDLADLLLFQVSFTGSQ